MVAQPYVNHIPVMTGGVGHDDLLRFYKHHFIPKTPADTRLVPISRTIGADRVVDEMLFCFTHDIEIDWMLPGVAPTGRYVEIPLVAIVRFRGDKLYNEHIYWDQASVLAQIGLLDPTDAAGRRRGNRAQVAGRVAAVEHQDAALGGERGPMMVTWFATFRHDGAVGADDLRLAATVCWRRRRAWRAALIYTPAQTHDPYLDDGRPPALALQLYFAEIAALEAALARDGHLQALAAPDALPSLHGAAVTQQAMLARAFPVPDARCAAG